MVTRLNNKNLLDLWTTSCLISCIDYLEAWSGGFGPLFPMVNLQNLALFDHAVLASRAANYKDDNLTSTDLPYVWNHLTGALETDELNQPAGSVDETVLMFFATRANFQLRFQRGNLREHLGRAFALYDVLPRENDERLRARHKSNFVNLPTQIQKEFGLSVRDYLMIGFGVFTLYMDIYNMHFRITAEERKHIEKAQKAGIRGNEARAWVFGKAIDRAKDKRRELVFRTENLIIPGSLVFCASKINAFLRLVSAPTRKLRDIIRDEPVFSQGYLSDRVSPLERYPVIEIDQNKYTVPNFRYLEHALAGGLRFMLQEAYPNNEFNEIFGSIQEIYITQMISERLPWLVCIPETEYHRGKNRCDGPDLTVIDGSGKWLVALESKAKHITAATRLAPVSDALLRDLERVFEGLAKLPTKIRDLYAGLAEYRDYQSDIESTRSRTPICWVVMGEGVHFLPEVVRLLLDKRPDHFLNRYEYPYCLMGLDAFELAVEIAADHRASLYDLLQSYWRSGQVIGQKDGMAEHFGGLGAELPNTFMAKYASLLFELTKAETGGEEPHDDGN